MERFLCAWSPNWAIANWRRRNPSASPAEPLALVVAERGVRRLAALDAAAAAAGLFIGKTAADACALVPELVVADADPAADLADLEILGDWCARVSPAVALDPPDGLFLDMSGAAHLWGGERDLMEDGLVLRYRATGAEQVDGLEGREGAFLACSFWLADCLHLIGRREDARQLLERLLALRNDLGLLAEEYDSAAGRQSGNFPQAFSHVALVNAALNLSENRQRIGRLRTDNSARPQRSNHPKFGG